MLAAALATPWGAFSQETYGPVVAADAPLRLPAPPAIPDPLDQAATIAAGTHPMVGAAQAESRALDSDYSGARWRRFPNLTVEALAATKGSPITDPDGLALNLELEQPVWTGGRISGQIDRARASRDAGNERVTEAEQTITIQVTEAYYDFVGAAQRVAILDDSLKEHRELLSSIRRRVEQEVSPMADLTLGQSRTAQVEFELSSAEEQRLSAWQRLMELTGGVAVDPVMPLPGVEETLPPEEVALSEALSCSPTLGAMTDMVDVAQAERTMARGNLMPNVALQLSQNEITGTRAAVVLRSQTGYGLSSFAAVDSADARIKRAMAEFGEAERKLREQMRRDYILVRAARRQIESGMLAADASAAIIDSYQRQFIAGRRSWLDVMNAVREAASARLSESDARVTAAVGTARLLALACRWQPALDDGGTGL